MADFRVDCLESVPEILALRDEWNPLLEASRSNSVFLRYEWISTWWDAFGERFQPLHLTLRDPDGTLVGLAPLMLGRGRGRIRHHLRHLMIVGQQGGTLAEHLDLVVRSGREEDVTPRLVGEILERRDRWDILSFERVPASSPNLDFLVSGLESEGLETIRRTTSGSPYLTLPGSFEDLLATKSKHFRRKWRNTVNRLGREGDVRLRLVGRDIELDEAFAHLVRLHRARWQGKGSFASDAYLHFHRTFSAKLLEADALLLALLEVDDVVVAARYDFVHAGKMWSFQGGWLPEYERRSVGKILLGHVLEEAIRRDLSEYDFLSGEDAYKTRWATGERELVDIEGFADRAKVRWLRRAQRVRDALRRWRAG